VNEWAKRSRVVCGRDGVAWFNIGVAKPWGWIDAELEPVIHSLISKNSLKQKRAEAGPTQTMTTPETRAVIDQDTWSDP
jgi:hypothetical protein